MNNQGHRSGEEKGRQYLRVREREDVPPDAVHKPHAVRSPHPDSRPFDELRNRFLNVFPFFIRLGKTARFDHDSPDAFAGALFKRVRRKGGCDEKDNEVNGFRNVGDGGKAGNALNFSVLRVDGKKPSFER
ncbi:MAG: hypothetical protein A4E72_01897 [Syntrophus sp. PtaU1.Bin208]|nr:MAG: hypothetical protein A4E72_01897 [Syntrophus sp. PtaU1.Bin208]